MNTMENSVFGVRKGSRMVVAGGCGGIGRALTQAAISIDVQVTVLDLAESIAQQPPQAAVTYVPFDGREESSIQSAVTDVATQWDAVDSFVFLSGFPILPRRNLSEIPLDKWNELMSVNLTSAYLLSRELLPLLKKGTNASIVTVASSLAYQVMPGMGAYAASKGGLVSLTKALAMELAPYIRVNSVAPGAVDTEFLGGGTGRPTEGADRSWFDQLSDKYISMIPLARVAEPSDVVWPILFLAGRGAAYMTGQVLHLNGGRLTP